MELPLLYILAYICGMMATSVCATGDSSSELSEDSSDNNPFGKIDCEEGCREEFPGKRFGRHICAFACEKERFEWYQPSKIKEAKECSSNCVTDDKECKGGCFEPCVVGCGVAFTEIPHEELSINSVMKIVRDSRQPLSNISLCYMSCRVTVHVFGRKKKVFKPRG